MNQNLKSNYIKIGTIVNTHGVKGEVRVLSGVTEPSEIFSKGNIIYFENNSQIKDLKINSYRPHKKFNLLTFEGINNINDIEWIKGNDIYVKRNLEDDEFYLNDLIDLNVYDQNNNLIGIVSEIIDHGPYESLKIKLNNGKSTNIPMIDEYEVKFNKDKITVNIPKEFIN